MHYLSSSSEYSSWTYHISGSLENVENPLCLKADVLELTNLVPNIEKWKTWG